MICNGNIFTPNSLNIFTDASIKKLYSGETIGCAGCLLVFGELKYNKMIDEYQVIRNTTNNNSEIKAVRLGIQQAIKYNNIYHFDKIRLFSDSQISIFGIRDRIFNWRYINGLYNGTDNKPIKNQDIFLEIIYDILYNNIHIEFYHQKGHVSCSNNNSILEAMHVFNVSNNIRDNVDIGFIKQISRFNDIVDTYSRNYMKKIKFLQDQYREPIYFKSNLFDKEKYLELIKMNREENYYE